MRHTLSIPFALAAIGFFAMSPPATAQRDPSPSYLGFDANNYPGDAALPSLKREFAFAGYWLNNPPGAQSNSWRGKRPVLLQNGFGFLVLFSGRLERELKSLSRATMLGSDDAAAAVDGVLAEGFQRGTIIFLDQEEGGRMESDQMAYIIAWIDGVIARGFRPGVYCSGMPATEARGQFIITADDIRNHLGGRDVAFFVYNDACPPSPGCRTARAPLPADSGIAFASIWQFAQSPRRKEFTNRCSATYQRDGNCYLTDAETPAAMLDLDSATSPDPSDGRRTARRRRIVPEGVAGNQRRKSTG